MKYITKALILAVVLATASFGFSQKALAATPSLAITNAGGDNVTISVNNADPYASVQLFYTVSSSQLPTQISNFGQTNGSGYFSTVISANAYGFGTGAQVYVKVNGQQSNIVNYNYNNGCGYYGCNVGGLTFNPSSLSLNVGQTSTVYISSGVNMSAYPPYISSNSNSNVASAYISGTQMVVTGNNSGSTTINVCLTGGSTCGNIYVTVSGSNNNNLSFDSNNISLNAGQSRSVGIYGNGYANGNYYYISSNSNPTAVSASISGTLVYLTGNSSGSANINVCQSSNSACGTLYVTVNPTVGNWSLSQSNVTANAGQTVTITANFPYVFTGSLSQGSNSNPNVASVGFSGSTIYVYGYNPGSTTISICYNSSCNNLYVTVPGNSGTISLSQSNVNLNQGQNSWVNIYSTYSNPSYYISSNTNSSVVNATLSGNNLNLYGTAQGNSTVTVCQNSGSCASVYVIVANYSTGSLSFTTTSLPQPMVGQYYSFQLQASGGTMPYYYSVQSGQLPAGLSLSSSGQIFGTPQNNSTANFAIRVYDNYSHNATMNFTLTPSGVLGSSSYNNGTLINEGGTIYIIYKNTKTGFASASAFLGLGFKFENAINVYNSNIPFSGYTVTTDKASHPWGSWIKSGQTVYFEHELGLIPVADYGTFLNNGGSDNLVVPANSFDFARPILSVMIFKDNRLQ